MQSCKFMQIFTQQKFKKTIILFLKINNWYTDIV